MVVFMKCVSLTICDSKKGNEEHGNCKEVIHVIPVF